MTAYERGGAYMRRWGPGDTGERPPRLNKKLCLYATDQAALIAELDAICARPECVMVKYSIEPRDGMYLGRAFLTDEALLGRLWAGYKQHPKIFCSVQDDDWARPFR